MTDGLMPSQRKFHWKPNWVVSYRYIDKNGNISHQDRMISGRLSIFARRPLINQKIPTYYEPCIWWDVELYLNQLFPVGVYFVIRWHLKEPLIRLRYIKELLEFDSLAYKSEDIIIRYYLLSRQYGKRRSMFSICKPWKLSEIGKITEDYIFS